MLHGQVPPASVEWMQLCAKVREARPHVQINAPTSKRKSFVEKRITPGPVVTARSYSPSYVSLAGCLVYNRTAKYVAIVSAKLSSEWDHGCRPDQIQRRDQRYCLDSQTSV